MKRWVSKLWILLPVILIVGSGLVAWKILQPAAQPKASAIACTDTNASNFSCFQTYYQTVVNNDSPEAAFVNFKKEYDTNPYVKSNCHQIGHIIGRAAALKYKTLAETYKHGDNFCWSGYYHGAMETISNKIGKDRIEAQLNVVCAELKKVDPANPYSFDYYNCVHGMGHGIMAVEDDNLFTALKVWRAF
jgi:hypothetical protein